MSKQKTPVKPYPTPGELRTHAMAEIAKVALQLGQLNSNVADIETLSTMLDRAGADNITSRLANARADLVAAHVHALMQGAGEVPADGHGQPVSRGQAIGLVMLHLGRAARNGVTRPLLESERRWNLPEAYANTPRSMSRSQRLSAGIESEES